MRGDPLSDAEALHLPMPRGIRRHGSHLPANKTAHVELTGSPWANEKVLGATAEVGPSHRGYLLSHAEALHLPMPRGFHESLEYLKQITGDDFSVLFSYERKWTKNNSGVFSWKVLLFKFMKYGVHTIKVMW